MNLSPAATRCFFVMLGVAIGFPIGVVTGFWLLSILSWRYA